MSLQEIVIVGGARTPFGKFGGSLRDVTATELGVAAAKGALDAAGVPADRVDHVIFGNVIQSSRDAAYLGRHVGLWAGVPQSAPGLTLNRDMAVAQHRGHILDRAALGLPLGKAAIQHRDVRLAHQAERPPHPRGREEPRPVVDDDLMTVADAHRAHAADELLGRRGHVGKV